MACPGDIDVGYYGSYSCLYRTCGLSSPSSPVSGSLFVICCFRGSRRAKMLINPGIHKSFCAVISSPRVLLKRNVRGVTGSRKCFRCGTSTRSIVDECDGLRQGNNVRSGEPREHYFGSYSASSSYSVPLIRSVSSLGTGRRVRRHRRGLSHVLQMLLRGYGGPSWFYFPGGLQLAILTEGPSDLVSGGGIFCRGHGVDGLVGGRRESDCSGYRSHLWSGVRERGRVVPWWIFDGFDVHADFLRFLRHFRVEGARQVERFAALSFERLATSLRGLWVSALVPPDNGGPCQRSATPEPTLRLRRRLGPRAGIPKRQLPNCHSTDHMTEGADSELLGWHIEEKEAQLPLVTKRYSQNSVGSAQKGGGPKTPVCEGEGTRGRWRRGATPPCAESWPCSCEGTWSHWPHWWYATVRRLVACSRRRAYAVCSQR